MRLKPGRNESSARASASTASDSHCALCTKRFHALRRKHRCQLCGLFACSRCIRTQAPRPRGSPQSHSVVDPEPVHVCFNCCRRQRDELRKEQTKKENARRLQQLELQRFGPRPQRRKIRRRRSCGDLMETTSDTAVPESPAVGTTPIATKVNEAEPIQQCAICEKAMDHGDALFTTVCSHSFHWRCLKTTQTKEGASNCPICHMVIQEMEAKKACIHMRVYPGNRFCRDCGAPVNELAIRNERIVIRQPVAATFRVVGLRFVRWLDIIAFGCVRLVLATVLLVSNGIHRVVRIPWVSYVDYLVFGCVRLLFHGALHVVYSFHRLLQPRRIVDRIRRQRQDRRHHWRL